MSTGIVGARKRYNLLAPFLFSFSLCAMDCMQFAMDTLIQEDDTIDSAFFTQQERATIENVLVGLIRSEQENISGALFRLSNKKITQELLRAHKRGVDIQIVFDPGAIGAQVLALAQAGIPLLVYDPKRFPALMHHKFLLFKNTLDGRTVLSTGSLNITEAGFAANAENLTVRDNGGWIQKFYNEFERLREKSQQLKSSLKKQTSENIATIPKSTDGACAKKSGKKEKQRRVRIEKLLLTKQTARIVRFAAQCAK